MTTVYNEFDQTQTRVEPFRVYHIKGKPRQLMVTRIEKPCARPDYYNSVNIIAGMIECVAPDGSTVQWKAGMCDLELPEYTQAGNHRLNPGPDGVEFFCSSICCESLRHKKFRRRLILPSAEENMQLASLHGVLLVAGSAELNGTVKQAPLVIAPREEEVELVLRNAKGVELWLE